MGENEESVKIVYQSWGTLGLNEGYSKEDLEKAISQAYKYATGELKGVPVESLEETFSRKEFDGI